jgi:hypothetical protein
MPLLDTVGTRAAVSSAHQQHTSPNKCVQQQNGADNPIGARCTWVVHAMDTDNRGSRLVSCRYNLSSWVHVQLATSQRGKDGVPNMLQSVRTHYRYSRAHMRAP